MISPLTPRKVMDTAAAMDTEDAAAMVKAAAGPIMAAPAEGSNEAPRGLPRGC